MLCAQPHPKHCAPFVGGCWGVQVLEKAPYDDDEEDDIVFGGDVRHVRLWGWSCGGWSCGGWSCGRWGCCGGGAAASHLRNAHPWFSPPIAHATSDCVLVWTFQVLPATYEGDDVGEVGALHALHPRARGLAPLPHPHPWLLCTSLLCSTKRLDSIVCAKPSKGG
jgi:hypothetical protein